jgi:hypothetical protein
MRKVAVLPAGSEFRRVMIYDDGKGVFLFLYHSTADGPCDCDYWYETADEADKHAAELGVTSDRWQLLPDPPAGTNQDRV